MQLNVVKYSRLYQSKSEGGGGAILGMFCGFLGNYPYKDQNQYDMYSLYLKDWQRITIKIRVVELVQGQGIT